MSSLGTFKSQTPRSREKKALNPKPQILGNETLSTKTLRNPKNSLDEPETATSSSPLATSEEPQPKASASRARSDGQTRSILGPTKAHIKFYFQFIVWLERFYLHFLFLFLFYL
ncbi:unnamed protein product, partial [Prunus brigantina]